MRLLSIALLFLGAVYVGDGLREFFRQPPKVCDICMRWSERNYLAHGIDPYDVSAQFTGEPITAQEATRIQQYHLQGEKACLPSGYPPWGIAASFLLLWTNNLAAAKMLFASFTIACLLGTCWMVYLLAKPTGIQGAQMLAALVFGMFANCSVLRAGQYALILNAFLLVAVLMIERRRQVATGLAMCLPAIKPTVSLPQFLVLIVRGEWIAILVSALVCAALAGLSWFLTGVDPIEMTQQMLRQAGAVAHGGTSLLEVLSGILTFSRANILLALCGVVLTLLSAFLLRRQSILPSLAISCIIGRFFYYHRQYDNAMLMLPMVCLGIQVFGQAPQKTRAWTRVLFVIAALSLLFPMPYLWYTPPLILLLAVIWLAVAIALLKGQTQPSASLRDTGHGDVADASGTFTASESS